MKKIRLSVELIYSDAKELEISNEDYERIKEKGISVDDPLYPKIAKLINEVESDKTDDYLLDYKIEDADNDTTIIDWSDKWKR